MDTSCKELIELFELFEQVGGKVVCDYYDKTFTLHPQNIRCMIQPNEINIRYFLFRWHQNTCDSVSYLPLKNKTDKIDKIYDYQDLTKGGFVVKFEGLDKYDYGYKPEKH